MARGREEEQGEETLTLTFSQCFMFFDTLSCHNIGRIWQEGTFAFCTELALCQEQNYKAC